MGQKALTEVLCGRELLAEVIIEARKEGVAPIGPRKVRFAHEEGAVRAPSGIERIVAGILGQRWRLVFAEPAGESEPGAAVPFARYLCNFNRGRSECLPGVMVRIWLKGEPEKPKNEAAAALGRKGGLKGGKSMTPARRAAIAAMQAARWAKRGHQVGSRSGSGRGSHTLSPSSMRW